MDVAIEIDMFDQHRGKHSWSKNTENKLIEIMLAYLMLSKCLVYLINDQYYLSY